MAQCVLLRTAHWTLVLLQYRRYRDPSLPIHRTEITRFPHAILEIKLALPEGEQPPEWVRELMESGLITEVRRTGG
jgi:SPX domain protein involved in polyphosphate accumulation